MKNELKEYLQRATNYLYPMSKMRENIDREKILDFCIKHGLDEKFLSLVEKDKKWCDIATKKPVKYLVTISKEPLHNKRSDNEIIDIQLMLFEMSNPVPVIKIIATNNFLEEQ